MPYTHLEIESHDWPFPNRDFDRSEGFMVNWGSLAIHSG
jgi:hypothetical protein